MQGLIRDIKFGFKLLLKDRAFTLTTVLTLAVCIGANSAIFTIVNSVLLRPLPVPESDRILLMSNQYPNAGVGQSNNSGVPDYYDRLRDMKVFEEQAMFNYATQTVEINGAPQRMHGMVATPSLFRLLRVQPALGRVFNDQDLEAGNRQDLILSYGLWTELFAADPNVLGRQLRLSGLQYTIVGVMPKNFLFMGPDVRFWGLLVFGDRQKSDDSRHSNNWYNIGRLKPGATLTQAQSQVDAINAANLERFPKFKQILINAGFHTTVEPLQEMLVRDFKSTLYLLWGGAIFVLAIGVVNIANLTLARSNLRTKEIVTRLALGAGRKVVARQLVTESVIVTFIGGVAGLMLGVGILRALAGIGLNEIPRASEIQLDSIAIAFTLGISVVVGVLIGLVPLGQLIRVNLSNALREEGRSGTGGRAARTARRGLVVAQFAFAFVLLIGAGLLLTSFQKLLEVDAGFKSAGVMTASINTPASKYTEPPAIRAFMNGALEGIRSVPGVVAVGATTSIPFSGNYNDSVIIAEGYPMAPGESLISPRQITVTPGYFEAMSIQLLRGRDFEPRDTAEAPGAVIVDERLAKKFWPNQDPIGRRMYMPDNPEDMLKTNEKTRWLYVVGEVKEVRLEDLSGSSNKAGTYYFPWTQVSPRNGTFAIKTSGDPTAVMKAVRAEIAKLDPEMPLFNVRTMEDRTTESLLTRKASMLLALSFGAVALFLTAIGIYGVLAYLVTQRTREIGIRIALGGTTQDIFSMVLREGVGLIMAGFVVGAVGIVALRHAIEGQIYGVQPTDPIVIASVAVGLGLIGILACTLPARRATRVNPVSILNQ